MSVGSIHRAARLSAIGRGICTIFVVVLASCSDPSLQAGPPADIHLLTAPNVTVEAMGVFPVHVRVTDANERAVADVAVVFQFVRAFGGPPSLVHVDTLRTGANGEAKINVAVGPVSGSYQMNVWMAHAAEVVRVSVTPGTIARLEIFPDSAAVSVGGSVALGARAFDQYGNTISIDGSFRSLTPAITETSAVRDATATVIGLAPGTGLIVAEHGQLADTARVVVSSRVFAGLALGARHSCMLALDGKIYCWGAVPGAGESGEICGVSPCLRTPRLINSTLRFEAIAAGGDQTCALSDSALYCWGRGGAVPGGESKTPQRVPGNFSFTNSFTVGRDHACATMDGAAYCWGDNSRGQLGTGDRIAATSPTAVLSAQRFSQLLAGAQFTCGLTMEDAVHCWGANSHGELGRGTMSDSEPVPAAGPNLGAVAHNIWPGAGSHVCVFRGGPATFCWGRNDAGQLRDGTTTSSSTPRFVTSHNYGVTTATGTCSWDGRAAWCWGSIGGYQYDLEAMFSNGSPMKAGGQHACASILVVVGGQTQWQLRCWGDNSVGALGDGTLNSSRRPVQVVCPTNAPWNTSSIDCAW